MSGSGDILVIGYGNPGRRDDGLGPALAAELEALRLPGVDVQADYQLAVEDAADVAAHRMVIFADAAVEGPEPFAFRRVRPEPHLGFSSHALTPQALLALAGGLFAARTAGYTLAIRGYQFGEFGESLSAGAAANLKGALEFCRALLRGRTPDDALMAAATASGDCAAVAADEG